MTLPEKLQERTQQLFLDLAPDGSRVAQKALFDLAHATYIAGQASREAELVDLRAHSAALSEAAMDFYDAYAAGDERWMRASSKKLWSTNRQWGLWRSKHPEA